MPCGDDASGPVIGLHRYAAIGGISGRVENHERNTRALSLVRSILDRLEKTRIAPKGRRCSMPSSHEGLGCFFVPHSVTMTLRSCCLASLMTPRNTSSAHTVSKSSNTTSISRCCLGWTNAWCSRCRIGRHQWACRVASETSARPLSALEAVANEHPVCLAMSARRTERRRPL